MNAPGIISHRMFVAALGQNENNAANKSSPGNSAGAAARTHGARLSKSRTPSPPADDPGQLMFAAITESLKSAEA